MRAVADFVLPPFMADAGVLPTGPGTLDATGMLEVEPAVAAARSVAAAIGVGLADDPSPPLLFGVPFRAKPKNK